MPPRTLADRMHQGMSSSGRAWPAEELGKVYLKLSAGGPAAVLIRRLLSPDDRFQEISPGTWIALDLPSAAGGSLLGDVETLLGWLEGPKGSPPEAWRLHLGPNPGGDPAIEALCATPFLLNQPDRWEMLRRLGSSRRIASTQPGPVGRFLQSMERRWAFPEWERPVLDLLEWIRVALAEDGVPADELPRESRLEAVAVRWSLGPAPDTASGAPLPRLASILDRLRERFGDWTEEELAERGRQAFGSRPVDWSRFQFHRETVDAAPDAAGIYRFYDEEGRLLYVGKAARLRERLRSYFRPLPAGPSRREQLLIRLRRFEVETAPSELEALLREAAAIRHEDPPWNVQIDVHPPAGEPKTPAWPLAFVVPGSDPLRATTLLLTAPDHGFLFHLPRTAGPGERADLADWLDGALKGAGGAGPCPHEVWSLEMPEVRLALRYYGRETDRLFRADSTHFVSGRDLLDGLVRLAREVPVEGVDQRPPRDPRLG